jgi:RNA polymerase sigma-70 factor (ECF subfamily)
VKAWQTEGGAARPRLALASASAPTDEVLCRAFLNGDEAAFGTLVERHRTLVVSLVRRFAPRPEDAADLAQQAFLRALVTEVEDAATDPRESPQEALEHQERERRLQAAVLGLPRRQREVLTLRVDAGLPFRDIAETLGITENNAKVQFHHAVKRLKADVADAPEEEERG